VAYKPPYLLLYVNDLLGSHYVDLMDMEQFGWYMRLLVRSWQWDTPCYLPNDMAVLRSILRIGRRQKEIEVFEERFKIVYERFSVTDDGKHIYHPKLVEQYEELQTKHDRLAEAGLKGGLNSGKARLKQPDSYPESEPESLEPKPGLPDWIMHNPPLFESWKGFVEMRQRTKSPLTKRAVALNLNELKKLVELGNDPIAVLNQSVMKSWKGLFPVSGASNGAQPVNRSRTRQELQRVELERAEEMDSQGAFNISDHDEGNGHGRSLERLCESLDRPIPTSLKSGIPASGNRVEILPKTSGNH